MSNLRRIILLLVLFSVSMAGGCAKVRRGLDWGRYENRLTWMKTPLYKIPSGFSSSYHRRLYGDERFWGEGTQAEAIPMKKGSGAFFPSEVDYDPMTGPDVVHPTMPVGESDPGIQQAINSRRRILLRR